MRALRHSALRNLRQYVSILLCIGFVSGSSCDARQDDGAGQGSANVGASNSFPGSNNQANSSGQKNSTRKIRVRPSRSSLRAGSAVAWQTTYDEALNLSKSTSKPIFWYVPTVTGTFMDRKTEVDRYMLSGPFSWPAIIELLNERFVPLRTTPEVAQAERFGIEVYKFIEPGFLIIQPDESVSLVADRLTTTNPRWFYQLLANTVKVDKSWETASDRDGKLELSAWWSLLDGESVASISPDRIENLLASEHVELRMIGGMLLHVSGQQQAAIDEWAKIAADFPEHPLGWKAACEAQRIGPFGRGFEVFGGQIELDQAGKERANQRRITSAAPFNQFSDQELWQHGVDFLLRMQDKSGGIFDSDYDFGGTDSLPNVYVAVTSLVGLALMEAAERDELSDRKPQILDGVRRALDYVSDQRHLNLDDRDEILWAQAYRVRFMAAARQRGYEEPSLEQLQTAVDQLLNLQMNTGTWYHEYANAFVTATALVALLDARNCGAVVDQEKVEKGLARLESQRFSNGAYPYDTRRPGSNDAGTIRDLAASGGRISICELARCGWSKTDTSELAKAVELSLRYHGLLEKGLKYDNHTDTYAYGGFFFWYDMQARSEAIRMLPAGPEREQFWKEQQELVRRLPEIDGCFVDSHELGRCYGTAMGLLSLGAP